MSVKAPLIDKIKMNHKQHDSHLHALGTRRFMVIDVAVAVSVVVAMICVACCYDATGRDVMRVICLYELRK